MKVTDDILFRYFRGKASKEEKIAISRWLEESEDNKVIFREASDLYEKFVMAAPASLLEHNAASRTSAAGGKKAHRIWMAIGNAAAVILFCIISFYVINNRIEDRLANTMNTITVPAGKSMDYTLSDGTTIRLNSGATLQYPMAFAKDHREVKLDGEAYFDVAHNENQPFIVRTFASDIEVLGTKFNVKADSEAGEFSATLIEGSIKISNSIILGEQIIMHPDEKVTLVKNHMVFTEHDPDADIIWTKGFIDISGLDFVQLMKKFEKSFGVKIIIDRKIQAGPVFDNGKLRISDGIDNALGTIRKGGVEFTYSKDINTNTIHIK